MANKFQHKRSTVAGVIPTTSDLTNGEIGINLADKIIYTNNGSAIVVIGHTLAGSNTQIQFNDSGFVNASAGMTFNKNTNNFTVSNNFVVLTTDSNTYINSSITTITSNIAATVGHAIWNTNTSGQVGINFYTYANSTFRHNGLFQQDQSGNFVFRQTNSGSIFFDYYNTVYFRSVQNGYNTFVQYNNQTFWYSGTSGLYVNTSSSASLTVGNSTVNTVANSTSLKSSNLFLTSNSCDSTITVTTTGTSTQTIDSYSISTYRSASYFYSVKDNNANGYQTGLITMIYDGSASTLSEFGVISTNSSLTAAWSSTSNSTTAILQLTPSSSNTTVQLRKILLAV